MKIKNTNNYYGLVAKFFHWTTAAAFIGAYIFVYYVIWFMDDSKPESLPVLNIHWALGIIVGALVLPRLLWKMVDVKLPNPPGTKWEHRLAHLAHLLLYALLVVMPLTGYLGTGADTNFGFFSVAGFNNSSIFEFINRNWNISWNEFEAPIDVVHHFLGKWVAWSIVGLHIAASIFHHVVRRDNVLVRMLPFGRS